MASLGTDFCRQMKSLTRVTASGAGRLPGQRALQRILTPRTRPLQECVRIAGSDAPATHAKANWKPLKGPCVVLLQGKQSTSGLMSFQSNRNATLQAFMAVAAETFANVPLPLGGKLLRVDDKHFELIVPKFELFDLWMQPKAAAQVLVFPEKAIITSTTQDCILEGSSHIKDMGLNERFNLDVRIIFTWEEGVTNRSPKMNINGSLEVEVDIPPPFSFMPQPVLKAAGDVAMSGVLTVMMPTFLEKLAVEYSKWAKNVPTASLNTVN